MKAAEIAALLARDTESVCQRLLPNGKREGHEWCVGSSAGEEGKSCKVHLSGPKAGVWKDFAAGNGGDLLDLWAATRGLSISEAMTEARSYLGVSEPEFHGYRAPTQRPEKPKCNSPKGDVHTWLTETRKLSSEAIKAYRIAAQDREVVFPYLHGDELVFCKFRSIDDKKRMRVQKDSVPCLFGWQAIPADAREVVICEGELDAPSWWMMGYPALSVPNGATAHSWVEMEYGNLERFDVIYLAFDADEPGKKGARQLAERLGLDRCRLVETPGQWKDANAVVQAGLLDAGAQWIAKAKPIGPEELKSASEFADDVVHEFYPIDGWQPGFDVPWEKAHGKVRLRYAELTLINGINGHGKSQLCGQVVLDALFQGEKACIYSGELKPRRLLYRMTRQACAMSEPSIPYIRAVHDWYADKLWIFDLVGSAKGERLLEVFKYARRRFDIRVFLIDSLMKCGFDEDDYNGQKRFTEALCDFKNEFDCHVFLVTHPRKQQDEKGYVGKMDVKGSGAITDLSDNVTSMHRAKKKHEDIARLEAAGEIVPKELMEKPDGYWNWDKQRNGDWEGKIALWWDEGSYQFTPFHGARPKAYVPFSVRGVA